MFVGWFGGPCTGVGACVLSGTSAQSVSARFVPRTDAPAGILPVTLDIDANSRLSALTDGLLAIRWMFGLTGSVLLSRSRACKNQAFRFKTRLFGFQYHFEFTEADVEALLSNDAEGMRQIGGAEAAKRILDETKSQYPRHARLGNRILENFVQYLKAY